MFELVMIDWTGPALSGEQMLALRNIAAIYLRRAMDKKVNFTHLLVEGKLSSRGRMTYGTFVGNRFFVDMGTLNGSPWYCEFLLPSRYEQSDFNEDGFILKVDIGPEGISLEEVDMDQARASEASIL